MFYSDGMVYEGDWVQDKRNGIGILFLPSGMVQQQGRWEEGVFQEYKNNQLSL